MEGGGAERVTANLIATMVRSGWQVDLVMVRRQGTNLARIPPEVTQFELGTARTVQSGPALARYLKDRQPVGLLAVMDSAGVAAIVARALARTPTRVAVVVHNALTFQASARMPLLQRWLPRLLRWSLFGADSVVAVSRGVAEEMERALPTLRGKLHTIYNPVVTDELLAKAAEPCGEPWAQPDQPPLLVAVGRLVAAKDFATLLRAFARLRARRPARLIIYGDGDLRPNLEALCAELGVANDVRMPGWSENPWATMSRAALFVLSSEYEALPTALIEALACGCPCVATDCRFGPREVLEDGKYGALVPVGDAAALADAMANALDSPPERSVLRKRSEAFSDEASLEPYMSLLR